MDGRFARMFKEQQFVETPKVDARGQPLKRSRGKEKLQEFYELAGVEGAAIAPENSENEEVEGEDVEEELDESEEEDQRMIQLLVPATDEMDVFQRSCSLKPGIFRCREKSISPPVHVSNCFLLSFLVSFFPRFSNIEYKTSVFISYSILYTSKYV